MADLSAINNIYNYFLTTYAPQKSDSRYDTHKKSELRGVYNSIVKINKDAPLAIVDRSQETKEYAVGLKENARTFHNTIVSLGGMNDDEMLDKKVAYSSDESLATVKYIGEDNKGANAPALDIVVNRLASPQINIGRMLPENVLSLSEDVYSFDVSINGLNYEFQYAVNADDTNRTVQDKLARLITNSGVGLNADVISDGAGNSALRIASNATGATKGGGHIFNITDDKTGKTRGSVAYFGLDSVALDNEDAEFVVNGNVRNARGNTFTVEKMYEINLNRTSVDETDGAHIELKTDMESVASNIEELIDAYNSFIDNANAYSDKHPKSERLIREMYSLASEHIEEFESLGIKLEDNARITIDKEALIESAKQGDVSDKISGLKAFAASMLRKVNQISIDPMHYVDSTIVAYKNPGHNFVTPYVTSQYTGMLFNGYC